MSNQLPKIPRSTRNFKFGKYDIDYTSFTMGLYSVLLESQEEGTPEARLAALKQLANACIVDSKHPVEELPIYIIEMAFVKSRILSLGGLVDASYRCKNEIEGKECGNSIPVQLNLEEVEVKEDPDYQTKFELGGGFGLLMQEPNLGNTDETSKLLDGSLEDPADIILMFMDCLYNVETVFKRENFTAEELRIWVDENLGLDFLGELVEKFYSKVPQIGVDLKFQCDKCGHNHEIELRGINQLFQ